MLGIRHAIYNGTIICHDPVDRMKKAASIPGWGKIRLY